MEIEGQLAKGQTNLGVRQDLLLQTYNQYNIQNSIIQKYYR